MSLWEGQLLGVVELLVMVAGILALLLAMEKLLE
jgi:hypothetical protein